jgi:hypothetical protein
VLATGLVVAALAAAADSTDPKTKTTKAGQAAANAAVLKVTDLGPAWSGGAEKPVSLKIPICPGNQPNDSDLTITGHAESVFTLESSGLQIDSDALVFKTPAQVTKLVARTMGKALMGCLEYNLVKSLGTSADVQKATQLRVAKAGDHVLLYRVPLKVKSGTQTVRVYNDFLFLSKGRTQLFVSLVAPSSLDDQLPALENRIAKTLAAHARA